MAWTRLDRIRQSTREGHAFIRERTVPLYARGPCLYTRKDRAFIHEGKVPCCQSGSLKLVHDGTRDALCYPRTLLELFIICEFVFVCYTHSCGSIVMSTQWREC